MERLIAEGPWPQLSLWTRESNHRAQRLYRSRGFVMTDELGSTPANESTRRWRRP
jgi:ribosomal protein S18 acetylase RimI-like enzyme